MRNSRRSVLRGDFGDLADEFHAGRAAADDRERQPFFDFGRIAGSLRRFECPKNSPPDFRRVVERFQTRGQPLPLGMAKIAVAGTGGENQRVEADGAAGNRAGVTRVGRAAIEIGRIAAEANFMFRQIEARHLGHEDGKILLPLEQGPQRRGDIRRRKRSGGDLVQQRLKQMVISPIDQRDLHRRAGQMLRRPQPTKSAADDDYAMHGRVLVYCSRHAPRAVRRVAN